MVPEELLRQLSFDAKRRQRRLEFLNIGPRDEELLHEIREFGRAHVDEIVEEFYRHLERFEETRALLGSAERIARLKKTQRAYFLRMLEGQFDAQYFESRLRVGDAHQRIDMAPEWYLGAFALYLRLLIERLRSHYSHNPDRLCAIVETLTKVIFLDASLAIDAYIAGGYVQRALAEQLAQMAQAAQRALQEKEELERLKTDLTNMIVHDLKGPIGGILTVTQLALRKRGSSEEAHLKRFEQIQRSARDLLRMIENLLEIDQMESGRLELRVEAVELEPLLQECASEYRAAAEMAGQTLTVEVNGDLPVLATDRWLLRRILNNLVVNAIRHAGSGVKITLGARANGERVEVFVTDTGRGIPTEEQATLFDKHRHGSRGTHREDTGLGLVFCKMAAETMGGSISVWSEPNVGTRFTVTLPSS
ncbi:MAG: protoglobin domain-containing protein [Candidatus Binatia bacterium]|nr:protoglobin domain-containing protein [Candidatus Binatia bacterium]